jgi:ribosomal protein RSM22 (predicted rRNA methylase)
MAHTAFRMPLAFAITRAAMRQVQARAPHFAPRSVLDFGAGPGTSLWAAEDVWGASAAGETAETAGTDLGTAPGLERLVAVEPSRSMVVAGQALVARGFRGPEPRWTPSLAGASPSGGGSSPGGSTRAAPLRGAFDLVVAANVLGELSDGAREAALRMLWQLTADGGVLLLAEPGSRWG